MNNFRKLAAVTLVLLLLASPPAFGAVGDTVADCQSINAAASLTLQPGAGVEWTVHSIEFKANVEFIFTDGTDTVSGLQFTGPGYQTGVWHVTNGFYMQVKNIDGSAQPICYRGKVTK